MDTADFTEPTPHELRARRGEKWSTVPDGVLPLTVAEVDFRTPPCVVDALHRAVTAGVTGYPDRHQPELFEAWCAYAAAQQGLLVDPHHVRLLPDIMTGVTMALRAFTPPGGTVLVPVPSYPPAFLLPRRLGYTVHLLPMHRTGGRYTMDPTALADAFTAGAHTLYLIQPHNPTGTSFTPAELRTVADIVAAHGGRVISDEVFAPTCWSGHTPYAAVSSASAQHTVTLTTAGKAWGFTGLRCGLLSLHSAQDAQHFDKVINPWDYPGASSLGIVATTAAYAAGETWRQAMAEQIRSNGARLEAQLSRRLPRLGWRQPDATYLAWLDLRPYGLHETAVARLRSAGLAVIDGRRQGPDYAGFVRLNIATTPAILDVAIERLCQAAAAPPREAG